MSQLPRNEDTPFSLPRDVPEVMPADYPQLNGNADAQEAYDEGIDDLVDVDPYRFDDDPIKSAKRLLKTAVHNEKYTTDHNVIRRWAEHRYGHPACTTSPRSDLDRGGLRIYFEDNEPEVETEQISWPEFFKIFERNNLAFVFKTKMPDGTDSQFYSFVNRTEVERLTEARRVP
jgi:hypothetical protein